MTPSTPPADETVQGYKWHDGIELTSQEVRFFRHCDLSPVRRREAPSFKTGQKAPLRVNLEQAPAFRPGSRVVHFFF